MPASVTSRTVLPVGDGLHELRRPLALVALEVRHHASADRDAQLGREPAQPAGVLGGDHVGRREQLRQPRRGVVGAADRSGSEDEHGSIVPARTSCGSEPRTATICPGAERLRSTE